MKSELKGKKSGKNLLDCYSCLLLKCVLLPLSKLTTERKPIKVILVSQMQKHLVASEKPWGIQDIYKNLANMT